MPELRGKVQRSRWEGQGVLPIDLESVHVEQMGALSRLPRFCRPVQRVLRVAVRERRRRRSGGGRARTALYQSMFWSFLEAALKCVAGSP